MTKADPAARSAWGKSSGERAVRYPSRHVNHGCFRWPESWRGWAARASARPASSGCTPAKRRPELHKGRWLTSEIRQVVGRTRMPASDCLAVTECASRDRAPARIGEAEAGV